MSENTTTQKAQRAYKRLMIAIMEDEPLPIIKGFCHEYEVLIGEKVLLEEIIRECKKYIVHYQAGHAVLVSIKSPLAQDMMNKGDMAIESKEDRILRRRMNNKSLEQCIDHPLRYD